MIHSIPTYLKGMATEVDSKLLAEIQSNYGENSTAFKFNKKFKSLERTWLTEYNEFGLTVWGINERDEKILIFDPMANGYNGLFELNNEEDLNSTKITDFENEVDLILMFQYGGDEVEYAQEGAEEGKSEFAEDYFDWLAIYKYDNNCLKEIVSIECA